jgi:hypothetical protein
MSNEIATGDRVVHPKLSEWGVGQVVNVATPNITVYFENVGKKTFRIDLVDLHKVKGADAESSVLDSKFKRRTSRKLKREFDPGLFEGGRSTSRKRFIETLGGDCANWNWSWSFINRDERKIFFGAWLDFIEGDRALIFSNDWKVRRGRNSSGWPESRENIRRIEEEGYSLHVFTIVQDPDSESNYEVGPRKIGAIRNDVSEAQLLTDGNNWYAVFSDDLSAS